MKSRKTQFKKGNMSWRKRKVHIPEQSETPATKITQTRLSKEDADELNFLNQSETDETYPYKLRPK